MYNDQRTHTASSRPDMTQPSFRNQQKMINDQGVRQNADIFGIIGEQRLTS